MWEREGAYRAEPEPGRRKFFVTAAFPYPNSPIHIGNARSYVLADIVARHRRVRGYNVLYPMGFHYTGTPILTMAESISEGDRELFDLFTGLYGVPPDVVPKLADPLSLARYFHEISRESMKALGLGIDWRREFTTIDPHFQSFIRWQFEILRERGYLTRGTHPVGWCPRHEMPVGGHDTKDDKDPEIGEFTLIFFKGEDGRIYPAATLRPETIFGVTNIWINTGFDYVEAEVEGSRWVVSRKAFEKLAHQIGTIKLLGSVDPGELLGKLALNPVTGERVPIAPGRFVDPGTGTGVVMSVPAHSPDDYVAYAELEASGRAGPGLPKPRTVIRTPGLGDMPARVFVEKHGARGVEDREALEKATKELYSLEYSSGSMERGLSKLVQTPGGSYLAGFVRGWVEGKPVPEARENLSRILRLSGAGGAFYEIMNKPVYCRCGTEVVVKLLQNQWFIDYSSQGWKSRGLKHLRAMAVQPPEAREHMEALIRNLREKPCARTRGLGTPLPWDPSWVIESLSDSTIYMAFYTVAHRVKEILDPSRVPLHYGIESGIEGGIERLDRSFWDHVILGRGSSAEVASRLKLPRDLVEALRREASYWYPLDLRVAGKDLSNNHLLFFIMNHAAVFPEDLQPRAILVHGWVLREGRKMSKSLRNILPVSKAVEMYGSDTVRVSLATLSEVGQDLDFRHDAALDIAEQLKRIHDLVARLVSMPVRSGASRRDRVFASKMARKILKADDSLEKLKIREAGIRIIYDVAKDVAEYLREGESVWEGIMELARAWTVMLSIYAPHTAEEIWHSLLKAPGLVVREALDLDRIRGYVNSELELGELYLEKLASDVSEIARLVRKRPSRLVIYTSPQGDLGVLRASIEALRRGEGLRSVIESYTSAPQERRAAVAERIKKIYSHASALPEEAADLVLEARGFNEAEVLKESVERLREILGIQSIEIYSAEDPEAPDYGKKGEALPLRPGVYIE